MSSLEPCRSPAWQAPVCEDQSVSQANSRCASVADPARERRQVAVAERPLDHVVGEPVDLEEVDAGHVASLDRRRPWRRACALEDVAVVEVVVVDRQQRGRERVDDRDADRDRDPGRRARERASRARSARPARTTAPFSTSTPSPRVSTVNGSATRISERPDQRVDEADQRRRQERRARPPRSRSPGGSRSSGEAPRPSAAGRRRPCTADRRPPVRRSCLRSPFVIASS